jgi:hypothetical protein
MEYDATGNDVADQLRIRCPCDHPSHAPKGCENLMHAGEEKCPACKDHVDSATVP